MQGHIPSIIPWTYLNYECKVERLWHKNGNSQGSFFSRLSRQIEDKNWEIEDTDTGDDQIHDVEQRFPPNFQIKENV